MRRREFLGAVGGATVTWPFAVRAQQTAARPVRVGLITPTRLTPAMLGAFREGMPQLGYAEGQNLFWDVRWRQGSFGRKPGVVAELVDSDVDVIVAWATPSVVAVRRATSTIPVVMVSIGRSCGIWLCRQSRAA